MPTLNFPTSPTLNQTYSFEGKTWVWNGLGWQLSASGAINNIPIGNITPASGAFTTLAANTFAANGITVLGNITGANLNATGNLSIAGNVNSPLNVRANVTATNLTTVGTLTAGVVSTTGNVTGAYFIGDGSQLTNLPGTNYSNANVANYLPTYTGNLPNLTGPVTTTGNLTGSNIVTSGLLTATGNITGGNLRTAGSINATGNITGGNLATGNIVSASINSSGLISAAGNITGAYIFGNGSQLTGLPATYSNANVAAYLPIYTGSLASLTGPVTTTQNITGSNIITSGTVTATGNITSGNIRTGNVTAGNVSATGNVRAVYFLGDGSQLANLPAGNYSNANVANYLPTYTGNLPNLTGPVTTTGNLTGGNVLTSGVISAAGIITGGNVSTGNITAGNVSTVGNVRAAYFLGDGSQLTNLPLGNYSNANVANYLPTYTGNLVSLTGPVTTTSNITGGNLRTAGSITATGNITGGNIATGNITGGNAIVSGTISATGNIAGAYILGDGSQLTNLPAGNYSNANVANYLPTYTGNLASLTGPVTTTGNLTGSNVLTSGLISATGNITSGNIATGNILAGNVSTAGNVSGTYILGDGSQLTNLPAGNYSNANVANYLPTYTGNLVSLTGPVTTTANITGGNLVTAGSITATGNIAGGNIATGNLVAANVESLGTVSAVGNVTGTYFIGNGAFLTGIASGNNDYSNANVAAYLPTYSGNLVSLTGPVITTGNITGGNVSTAGNVNANNLIANSRLKVGQANIYPNNINPAVLTIQADAVEFSGLIIAIGNITGNNLSAVGNIFGSNIRTSGMVSATGNMYAANFIGNVTGNITAPGATTQILFNDGGLASANAGLTFNKTTQVLSVTGNIQSGNLRTAGLISATGNIAGQYFVGNGALLTGIIATAGAAITNGNSNVTVSGNGNVTVTVAGVANVATFATTGVYVPGLVSVTGNVAGSYLLGNGAFITGLPAGYSNADVAAYLPTYSGNLPSLTGLVSTTGNISGNYILGNGSLLTGIDATSIQNGTSNVRVVSSGGNVTIGVGGTGNVAVFATTGAYITGELSATGNIAGNYFIGNGSQLTGVAASSVNANALVGNTLSANVLYSSLTTVGNLANLSVVGNTTSGNLLTGGLISATGNIDVGNINTSGIASVTGNIIGGNILTGGLISATGNIDVGNIRTAGIASVTGNITSGNLLTGGLISATGNIVGGNITTAGLISATGNVDAGNINTVGFASVTGNITGGNLSTSGLITASGNISGNNIFATTLVSVTGNLIAANVNTSAIRPTSGELTITTAAGNLNLQPAGNIVLANTIINSLAYPLQDTDAASKLYVDNMVSTGIAYHSPVSAATTTDLATATGGSITYAQPNGVANGIGATLTTTGSFNLIDTANVQTIGTRILVQNEGNTVFNGVYTWANTTVIVRSTDADQYGPDSTEQLSINDYFFVQNGTVNKGAAFVVSAPPGTITFGTSGITFSQFSSSQTYTANTNAGISLIGTQFNTKVDNDTTAFDGSGNIIVKAGANLTTPNIGAATGTSLSLTGNAISGNVLTGGLISATGNITGGNLSISGNISGANVISGTTISATANVIGGNLTTGGVISATANVIGGNLTTGGVISATSTITSAANITGGNILTAGIVSATGNITGDYILGNGLQLTGILGNNVNMGTNTAGTLVSNAVTLTTATTVTNGLALLNQVLGKLVPPSPPNFPGANTLSLSGITTYRMANITQVDNTPGANRAVAAGTSVANVLRVATYATNTIANVGPGDSGTITAVRNGSNVGNVTLNTNASPSANGTYGSNLVISNNFDYNSANANITAGFWYVFSSRVSGASAPAGWNELYIADSSTGNTNTTVWYYDNSSPSAPSFSSTTMTPPGSANLLYSSTIPHYTNNNNFTIAFNVANISGNTYPTSNTLASGSSGGAFAAPTAITYSGSNIGSNVLNSFASASANTTTSVTTGFGGSATGPSMTVNNSYSTGTLTLTAALGNIVLWKSGTATAIDESNVVINTTIGTGSGNAYRIINPGTGNTPAYTGSEAAFNSQSSTLQTYDATVVGSGSSGVLKHDQTNYASGYLPTGPNLSAGRSGTQYFTIKFVRTAVSKFDIKYTGTIAGMWVALPGSVIDSSSSANGWINMAVAYGGAGYPGVNSPGNGSDGCAVGGTVSLNTSVTNSSKTCTFGTVSSSSTATNEIYVRIALTSGQSVTALTLETASN